jgi:hypothetical protein
VILTCQVELVCRVSQACVRAIASYIHFDRSAQEKRLCLHAGLDAECDELWELYNNLEDVLEQVLMKGKDGLRCRAVFFFFCRE